MEKKPCGEAYGSIKKETSGNRLRTSLGNRTAVGDDETKWKSL